MKSNYKRIGGYIRPLKVKNTDLKAKELLGINIDKYFMPSVANVVGTNLSNYKVVERGQFACNRMHVGRDKRIPIALSEKQNPFIVSPAYDVFEIIDTDLLAPEYLMMWFSRIEFDRNAWFYTDADVRGGLSWDAFCSIELPVPSIEKQREIVKEYNTIVDRIKLNEKLNQKLEETAQAIYKHWFVDFEFPDENGQPYRSSGGEMVWNEEMNKEIPKGWEIRKFEDHVFFQEGPGLRSWQWTPKGMKVINVKNIQPDGSVDTSNSSRYISLEEYKSSYQHFSIENGDIIIAGSGATYGKVGKILEHHLPIMMNTSVIRFHSKNDDIFPNSFLQVYLDSRTMKNQIENYVTGSAQPNFGPTHIKQMTLLCPINHTLKRFDSLVKPTITHIDLCNCINLRLKRLEEVILSKMANVENGY